MSSLIEKQFEHAVERYAEIGVEAEKAIESAMAVPISLHCWQADDIAGLETGPQGLDGGGIMATGNYPGRARNGDEVRRDCEKAMSLIPGTLRINIHAFYAETAGKAVERDELRAEHFARWIDWARERDLRMDFNPTAFSHPRAEDGFTLSHPDKGVRDFWIRHVLACRRIGRHIAEVQGEPCLVNHWIPDGAKDLTADRRRYRRLLMESLDEAIGRESSVDKQKCRDYVESKLFGIGSEEYVVGSAEFYSNYALTRGIGLCLDMGHFHPTETIHDKLSAHLLFQKSLLLHVSRGVRWDSDHVPLFSDDVRSLFLEVQRGDAWGKVAVATDFFDASINRIAAYVIGVRATRQAVLYALLDPTERLKRLEREGNRSAMLALMEACKALPFGAVWDMLCVRGDVPPGNAWVREVEAYERDVLSARDDA